MGTAPRGPFDGRVGPNRRFATAERPFAVFRGIKESLGGTVNDVVLAVVAGGVRALLKQGRGHAGVDPPRDGARVRALARRRQ